MKYRKRSIICNLLAGLTALISSCTNDKPSLQLLLSKQLDFPSASAIEFHNSRLYAFGDDAPLLLVLSTDYRMLDTIRLVADVTGRISKEDKPDIESATIVTKDKQAVLYGIGSMSAPKRWMVTSFNVEDGSLSAAAMFPSTTKFPGINEINIEGSCTVDGNLIFANRANLSHPINHLILKKADNSVEVKKLLLPTGKTIAGVSGLYYVKEKDLLLITASEEETASSYEDGEIGESYLGWIENFSAKTKSAAELNTDEYVKLTTVSGAFMKQKIESVCVEKVTGNELLLHLVADNDKGDSHLFKLALKL